MARPRIIQDGVKLNLYVPLAVKQRLFQLASANRRSLSSMVSELVILNQASAAAPKPQPEGSKP